MSTQISEFYAKITADTTQIQASLDKLNQKLEGTKAKTQSTGGVVSALKGHMASLINPTTLAIGAFTAITGTMAQSYGTFQKYAGSVRDVALASGSTAEEASRLIQVMDDFEISAGDVMTATKALTKNGMEPSLETMAQLADEYVKIKDPMQKNEFLLKNLGKAGLQYANAMSQGGDALRDAGKEINKSLILTDEQIKKAEMARLAVDSWSDSWEGFKVSIGGAIGGMIAANAETEKLKEQFEALGMSEEAATSRMNQGATPAFDRFRNTMEKGAAMTEFYRKKYPELTSSMDDATLAQAELEASSQKYMDVLGSVSSETQTFTEKNQALLDELKSLRKEQEGTKEGSDQYEELTEKIGETEAAITSLAEEHAKASKQIMFDLISQQAAADGFKNISVEALATIGEQWGVLAKGSGDATSTMITQAEAWSNALAGVPGEIQSIAAMWASLRELSKSGITLTANIVSQATKGAMGGQQTQGACFTGDTPVMLADRTTKPIKDIQIGDEVLSYDLIEDRTIVTTVTLTIEHPANEGGRLLLINGYLKVTEEHLLWTGNEFKAAGDFINGDILVNLDGSHMRVVSVREIVKNEPTYNIHVDHDAHNYYAGGVLVHNAKEGGLWTGGMVGSFAGGGNSGGWGLVGDRQGGGFIPGVSELIYGNARVYNSSQSEKMLRSGMFEGIKGFAEAGDVGGGVYNPPSPPPPVVTSPISGSNLDKNAKRRGSDSSGDSSSGSFSASVIPAVQAIESQVQDMQTATQAVVMQVGMQTQQMTQQLLNSNNQSQAILEQIAAILTYENPSAVGRAVAYEVAKGQ